MFSNRPFVGAIQTDMESNRDTCSLCEIYGELFMTIDTLSVHKETEHQDKDLFDLFLCSEITDEGNNLEKNTSDEVISRVQENKTIHTLVKTGDIVQEEEFPEKSETECACAMKPLQIRVIVVVTGKRTMATRRHPVPTLDLTRVTTRTL